MNNLAQKLKAKLSRKSGAKNLLISIVILVEIIAIMTVISFAWVETVSSIKITNEANTTGTVDTYVFTEATIGGTEGTIDLGKYFKQSGDMHFAPASSAYGDVFYFPKVNTAGNAYSTGARSFRKGNSSDKNTAYLSATFKLKADTNADFFFEQVPTFSAQDENIRVSVTAYPEGMSSGDLYESNGKPKFTKVYGNNSSTAAVVNGTSSTSTAATNVMAFSEHIKGRGTTNRLFAVGANETKIVTINVWLQGTTINNSLPQNITISNFGITSSLTPRHVTLLPTPEWDRSGETQYFYAWCWDASNGDADRLYKLELDSEEHYSFDYNGTYRKTLFIRAKRNDLTTANMANQWNTTYMHNKTADTTIPSDPIDPTYIIETINGGAYDSDTGGNKSTGSWHDPATIKIAYAPNQSSTWGTIKATTYVGTTASTHVIETTNSSSQKHTDTVHAWPGKAIKLEATANTNYAFVGWYTNAECTGTAVSNNASYTTTAPSTATEITYYAKFKEVRTLTIYKYVDGSSSYTAAGTITIGGNTSGSGVLSYSQTYDKGTSVAFSATAATGYTLQGIYTTATGTNTASSPVTLNNNTTYYARFTTNSYDVTASAYYSTNGGSSYTAGNTGGTVKAGTTAAGATSTASVKYKSSVNLVATPASGYEFVGWYTAASGGTELSTNTTYSYTMNATSAQNVYARFIQQKATTIYMTYRGYSHMRIYIYGKSTGREYNGTFPGSTIPTYTGNRGLYSYTFNSGQDEDIGIIVSDNGSDTIRNEYTAHIGETCLIGPSGSTIDRSFTLGTKRYVYFTKNWTNNYIHYWGGNIGTTSWPGNSMNSYKAYTNEYNQDVLYYVINTGNTAVIFHSNSGTQTGDTTLGNNSCFYFISAGAAAGTWSPPTD